jgi:FKBP-type peptidyl-prolyl cis-trans isomerase
MKNVFVLLILACTVVLLTGCSKKSNVVSKSNGLEYVDDTVGTGRNAELGDLVSIRFTAWMIKDSSGDLYSDWSKDSTKKKELIGATSPSGKPFKFLLNDKSGFIKGSTDGIVGMKVGGTRTIIIPSEIAYGKIGYGPIPPNTKLKTVVQLIDAKKPVEAKLWDIDSTKYIKLKDGLEYAIVQQGTGPKADSGDIIVVNYSGYLGKDSSKFDSSVERDEPITFKLGTHTVMRGWEEGFRLFNKGTKARLIIPPSLGYGDRPMRIIPANSTLIFDVELLDIKSGAGSR